MKVDLKVKPYRLPYYGEGVGARAELDPTEFPIGPVPAAKVPAAPKYPRGEYRLTWAFLKRIRADRARLCACPGAFLPRLPNTGANI